MTQLMGFMLVVGPLEAPEIALRVVRDAGGGAVLGSPATLKVSSGYSRQLDQMVLYQMLEQTMYLNAHIYIYTVYAHYCSLHAMWLTVSFCTTHLLHVDCRGH